MCATEFTIKKLYVLPT